MNLLHLILRDRNVNGVRQAALAIGAATFSGLNIVVLENLKPAGAGQIVLTIVASALSLAVIVSIFQRVLLAAWASPILGDWVYKSSSGNWGLATLDIHAGDMRYSVQLYHTEEDALAAAHREPDIVSRCFATVSSIGVTYQNGTVELVYKIDNTADGYAPRSGMLTLTPLSARAMKGYWKSDILGSEPSRGVLDMYRPNAMRSRDAR